MVLSIINSKLLRRIIPGKVDILIDMCLVIRQEARVRARARAV